MGNGIRALDPKPLHPLYHHSKGSFLQDAA